MGCGVAAESPCSAKSGLLPQQVGAFRIRGWLGVGLNQHPARPEAPSWAFLRKEVVTGPETLWAAVRGQHKSPRFCLVATLPLWGLTPDPRSSLAPTGT